MQSIRSIIFRALLLLAAVSGVIIISLQWMNSLVVRQYKSTLDVMTTEYRLIDMTSQIALAYNRYAKNVNDSASKELVLKIESELRQTLAYLDSQPFDSQSQTIYVGLKNTVANVLSDVDATWEHTDQIQKINFSTSYDEIMRKNTYVKDNVSSLLISQLQYSNSLQKQIDRFTDISLRIGVSVLLLMVLGDGLFAWKFSRSLTQPLEELTETAELIAKGNTTLMVSQKLLKQNNEVGRLAQVFTAMTQRLLESIANLNTSNSTLLQVKKEVDDRNNALQKMNKFMIDRELKMVELKKENEQLRKNL
jgi:nitrogen fixation/metabolism regulation signal transduction histidine kinase